MARTPDPADVVPGPLSSRALQLIAESIGACSREWQSRVRMTEGVRWRTRLHSVTGNGAPGYDVWLESWLPGQSTGWHDHGGTSGVMVVVRGELQERVAVLGGVLTQVRHIPEGAARPLRRRQVHDLANVSLAPAISVHAYSPPLETTRGYEIGAMGLQRSAPGSVQAS